MPKLSSSSSSRKQKQQQATGVFTQSDFNSNDGMLTSVWGPAVWHTLHAISFNYKVDPTPEEKKQYKTFFESLQHVLPCRACRENLKKNLKVTGYGDHVYADRETFSRYIFTLHQTVNQMLGKSNDLTYEKVRDRYENFRARCSLQGMSTQSCPIENGCTVPITGVKSKCVLRIVPFVKKTKTFSIDKKCLCKRTPTRKQPRSHK